MAKRIEIDGKFYRERRGKLVEIPAEWVGKFPTEQTIRKRGSKLTNKLRRRVKSADFNYIENKSQPVAGDEDLA